MPFLSFLLLCFCWGSTFVPLKEGLTTLPPLLFAGSRFVLAACVFGTAMLVSSKHRVLPRGQHLVRLTGAALLSITLNYGLLFWGAQFLPSGISGLVSFGAVALSLTALSFLFRLEKPSPNKVLGLISGLFGLLLLVAPKIGNEPEQFLGIAAIAFGGVCYALGSLLVRPLLKTFDPVTVTTVQVSVGGATLLLASLFSGVDLSALRSLQAPRAAFSLLYLVAVGSLLGFWLYYRLLGTWEVSRLALYNFVSPVIAITLGVLVYSEAFTRLEGLASGCLLLGVLLNYARFRAR